MLLHNLLHVPVGILQFNHNRSFAVLPVQHLAGGIHHLLACFQLPDIMIPQDVLQLRGFLIAAHLHQVIEPFIPFGMLRPLPGRQHAGKLHCHQGRVDHLVLRAAGMDIHALHRHLAGSSIKALIFQFAQGAAVHRIGELRPEAGNVKQIRAPADLLIRRECHTDLPVVRRIRRQHPFTKGHDFRNPGFVIRAQYRVSGGHDQVLAFQAFQEAESADLHPILQADHTAVIVLNHLGHGLSGHRV